METEQLVGALATGVQIDRVLFSERDPKTQGP